MPDAQQKGQQLLPCLLLMVHQSIPCPCELLCRFIFNIWQIHSLVSVGCQRNCQESCILPVCFDLLSCGPEDCCRCYDDAVITPLLETPAQPISSRSGLIAAEEDAILEAELLLCLLQIPVQILSPGSIWASE